MERRVRPGLAEREPLIPWDQAPRHLREAPGSFLAVLQTTDGEIATGILLPPWDGLCLALDKAEWVVDERFAETMARILNFPDLLEAVRTEVAKYTTGEVLARFAAHDFAAGEVASREAVFDDPTVQHLGLISETDTAQLGRVRQPAPMWNFSESPAVRTTHIGETGRDTREVLARHGLTVDEIDTLIADGVAKIPDGT